MDDVLIIFDDSKLPIKTIGNLLNDMNADLNFILETNGNKVNFLDLTIYKRDQTVETDIFYKPMDSKQYPSIQPLGRRPPSGVCPPSRVSHSARPPLVPGQVARPHFPTAPPTSRHPNPFPPSNPNLNIPPPNSPPSLHSHARPNMPSIICPTYPPLTSPALPPISLPPRTPHPYNS